MPIAPRVVLLLSFVALGACTEPQPSPPPVFGGRGAEVAPAERPLPPAPVAKGPCAEGAPASDTTLFDDFEDGDAKIFKGYEREGWWFTATDKTPGGKILPEEGFHPERLGPDEATPDNLFAAHLAASGFKEWGAIWGVALHWVNNGVRCPFNASAFSGLKLRVRGSGTVRLAFGMPETLAADGGGSCVERCWDSHGKLLFLSESWQELFIPWEKLQQEGWGAEARFDPAKLLQIGFQARSKEMPVDFWVDDISFVKKAQ